MKINQKRGKVEGNNDEKRIFAEAMAALYIALRMPTNKDKSLPWTETESEHVHTLP